MIITLDRTNTLKNSDSFYVAAFSSMRNNIDFYIATKVLKFDPKTCDVLFIKQTKNTRGFSHEMNWRE